MDINLFWEFLILSEIKNYSLASQQLFISEPTLSRHMKSLEDELGVKLFERQGLKLSLTKEGTILFPYAERFVTLKNRLAYDLSSDALLSSGKLVYTSAYRTVELVDAFSHSNPDIDVIHISNNGGDNKYIAELLHGEAEVAITVDWQENYEDITALPVGKDSYAVVISASHPLAKKKSLKVSELKKENFISFKDSNTNTEVIYKLCRTSGFEPKLLCTAKLGSDVINLVKYGGVSIVRKNSILRDRNHNVAVIDLDPPYLFDISLCFRNDIELSAAASNFINFVTSKWDEYNPTSW